MCSAALPLSRLLRTLRIVAKLLRREERRRPEPYDPKQRIALVIRTSPGIGQRRHRRWWRRRRWFRMRMRMVAALARAGPVVTAARPVRALPIALTNMLAFALVATPTVRAVMIHTALGADARPVIDVVATEQPITAIERRAVIGRRHPAGTALGTATGIVLDTLPITTLLALAAFAIAGAIGAMRAGRAIAIVAAFSAGGAVLGGAADEIGAALHPVLTRIGFAQGAIVAFAGAAGPDRHTFAFAALLTLAAFAVANAARAETTCAAITVVAAFRAIAALATRAAEEIVAAVPLGAGTVRDRAGFT